MTGRKRYDELPDDQLQDSSLDCSEMPPMQETTLMTPEDSRSDGESPSGPRAIRVPRKPAVFNRWKVTWKRVDHRWHQGMNAKEISEWLHKVSPSIACSPDTLRKIIKAGEAGLLDD